MWFVIEIVYLFKNLQEVNNNNNNKIVVITEFERMLLVVTIEIDQRML